MSDFDKILDIIDMIDSDQTPPPYWDNIKLPIVTNLNQQFSHLFKSYNTKNMEKSKIGRKFIDDLWNFVFGNKIPFDVYDEWVNKLDNNIKKEGNIEDFYDMFFEYLIKLPLFIDKFGEGDTGLEKFIELKIVEFFKNMNKNTITSNPFSKKYIK